ncbi:DUF6510 family protein [Streptomyces filamentosus]|uniref:Uncharacterized protein n=1 Tax=Streptomyces filamentosus TaxID=67294 RepID=A0A919BZ59_STRFL|nr:DUF6510 family protein [Streptomyces filamentosus]GHG27939.1 hypothetical protein GCM10017667_76150 [Streptomyces filamentosus]
MNQHPAHHLDGNCLAGPLAQVFALDPTTAWWTCPDCRTASPVGGLHVYGPEPGLTGRCPGCAQLALRVVTHPGHLWLQLGTGRGAFRFPLPPSPSWSPSDRTGEP